MRAVDLIKKKRDGLALSADEIENFVQGAASGAWEKYQVTAFLMAVYFRGMTDAETAQLTAAMVRSGARLAWAGVPGPKVDKHSTGGVGDKTSLVLAPIAAACGVKVPMMSGRGLGHTGGTLDKLEAIPGFRVHLSLSEFQKVLAEVGVAMIGQTAEVAPADKLLYALRDVTATVESIPLIAASIMSKKLAEGIDALVMDVKVGAGAFMKTQAEAEKLAQTLVAIGAQDGVRTTAFITGMDEPLGRAIGNRLEVVECIETLKGKGPDDLTDLSTLLAAEMVRLGGLAGSLAEAEKKVTEVLKSGQALQKLRELIQAQGGDPGVVDDPHKMPIAPDVVVLKSEVPGHVQEANAAKLGLACMMLGAGREKADDTIDHAVGAVVLAKRGKQVDVSSPLVEIHYRDQAKLARARPLFEDAFRIGPLPPPPTAPLIRKEIAAQARELSFPAPMR
jgi:pyrimidine-nucleoside phosphorylase